MPPFRRTAAIVLAMLSILVIAAPVAAKPGSGNSPGSAACENGGYLNFTRANGTTFKNEGDCAKYTAKGGVLMPLASISVEWSASSTPGHVQFTLSWSGYNANASFIASVRYGAMSLTSLGGFSPTGSSGTWAPPFDIGCQDSFGRPITALVVQKGTSFEFGGGGGWNPDGSPPVVLAGPDATLCPPPG